MREGTKYFKREGEKIFEREMKILEKRVRGDILEIFLIERVIK